MMRAGWLIVVLMFTLTACGGGRGASDDQVAIATANARRVVDAAPSWSPAGDKIAFTSDRERDINVWTVDVSSGELSVLNADQEGDAFDPVWSPDGAYIAYVHEPGPTRTDIWIVTPDGSERINLTAEFADFAYNITPSWDGTGQYLTFSSRTRTGTNVNVVAVPSGDVLFSTESFVGTFDDGSLSPDGSQVAYASLTAVTPGLFVADVDTGEVIEITDMDANDVRWSPLGDQLAFTSGSFGNIDLFVIDVDGENLVNLTEAEEMRVEWPTWSPDGERLAFQAPINRQYDLWTVNVDGSDLTNHHVDSPQAYEARAAWSPDGEQIAFMADRAINNIVQSIWLMNADGSEERTLTGGG